MKEREMKRLFAVVAVSLGVLLGTGGVAVADPGGAGPNQNANCNAIFTYINTHFPEVMGSRSDVSHEFKQLAAELGVPEGEIFRFFSQSHPGEGVC
jgi:hypothetical protein